MSITLLALVNRKKSYVVAFMLLHIFNSCHHGILLMSPLSDDRSVWEKKLANIYRIGHPIALMIEKSFPRSHPWVSIHLEHLPSRLLTGRVASMYLLPQVFATIFLIMFFPSIWILSQTKGFNLCISVL